jgi:hypothetical protein
LNAFVTNKVILNDRAISALHACALASSNHSPRCQHSALRYDCDIYVWQLYNGTLRAVVLCFFWQLIVHIIVNQILNFVFVQHTLIFANWKDVDLYWSSFNTYFQLANINAYWTQQNSILVFVNHIPIGISQSYPHCY